MSIEKVLNVGTSIATALGLAAAAAGVWYQYAAYEEESFTRRFSALALAWDIVRRADGTSDNIGQSSALLYLIKNDAIIAGGININNGSLLAFNLDDGDTDIPLNDSSFCKTTFSLSRLKYSRLNNSLFVRSFFISVDISGSNASGSLFNNATIWNVTARGSHFVAADLRGTKFIGGDFSDANFTGADLRGIELLPSYTDGKAPDLNAPMDRAFDEEITSFEAAAIIQRDKYITLDPTQTRRAITSFRDANFKKADLRGADLSASSLTQMQVNQACADETTRLPPGVRLEVVCTPDSFVTQRRTQLQLGFSPPLLEGPCAIAQAHIGDP